MPPCRLVNSVNITFYSCTNQKSNQASLVEVKPQFRQLLIIMCDV